MENSQISVWKLNQFRFEDVFIFFLSIKNLSRGTSDLRELIGQRPNAFHWWTFIFAVATTSAAATALATVSPFLVRSDRLEI